MQRRNREIAIFSLSAIDLFCSGMGAVMVLMVLLMPYYRKSVPALPPQPVELTKEPVPSPPGATIRVENIDLAFVIDATASMGEEINAVRSGLQSTVGVLRRLSDDVRIGFAAYTDREVPWTSPLLRVNRDSLGDANLKRHQSVIDSVSLVGNEDWPEHVYGGIEQAVSLQWPAGEGVRRQLIVAIGDAPTHQEHVEMSYDLVRRWSAAAPNRSVCAVYTGNGNDATTNPGAEQSASYLRELARAGGGDYLENQGDLMGAILDLVIVR